jgi:hypothetical protein
MMGIKFEPILDDENMKWLNVCDEAYGLLCLSISLDLLFHIKFSSSPNQIWTTLEGLFGKHDVSIRHHLENKIIILSLGNFDTIQEFLTKLKS